MMNFDIKAHLQNHAFYFKQYKEISKNDLHFNFSFLDIQFFNKDKTPEQILFELLQELRKPAEYKVKNGYYIDKQGNKNPKYTTRKIRLADAIKIEAIHIKGSEGEYTMPHIHLIVSKNARLGKDFSLLKTHIIEVSKKFGLRPNFAEITPNNPASYKNLQKAVKNFSWIIRKMPNKDFKKYVSEKLEDKLNKLWEYTLLSGNLQYYVKTLEFIKKRLNRQKLAFEHKGHNLRNTYPIPLTEQDLQVIELINKKKFSQKDLKPHLNNAILRDFVRYSYFKDKDKALIINSLSKQTHLLENLRPNKKVVENYLKLYNKILSLDKQQQIQEQQKQKETQSIKEILKEDLLKVAKVCINEKELRAGMQKLGYINFGFKKKSGKVYAYQFKLPNEDKKIIVKCADSIPISDLRTILKENWIKSKANEPIQSDLSDKSSQINTYTLPKPVSVPKALSVPYKSKQIELQKEKIREKRRKKYQNVKDNLNKLQKIYQLTKKINIQSKEELNIKVQEKVHFDIKLPQISLKNTTFKEVTNAKQYQSTIRTNLNTIKRYARELNQISRRKLAIEKEDTNIRNENKLFGERITKAINRTIKQFREKFEFSIRRISKRVKRNLTLLSDKLQKIFKNTQELNQISKRNLTLQPQKYNIKVKVSNDTFKTIFNKVNELRELTKQTKENKLIKYIIGNKDYLTDYYSDFLDYIDNDKLDYYTDKPDKEMRDFAKFLVKIKRITKDELENKVKEEILKKEKERKQREMWAKQQTYSRPRIR